MPSTPPDPVGVAPDSGDDGHWDEAIHGLTPEEMDELQHRMAVSDPRLKFAYLVPHLPQDMATASVFGWYTPGLHAAAGPLKIAAALPADIREPLAPVEAALGHRQRRQVWPTILPVETDSLVMACSILESPFQVVMTNEREVAAEVDRLLTRLPWPVLHASAQNAAGRTSLAGLDSHRLLQHVRAVADEMAKRADWRHFAILVRQILSAAPERRPKKHPLRRGFHNVLTPNEVALTAFGWRLMPGQPISRPFEPAGKIPQTYVDRICESADAVTAARLRLMEGEPPGICDYRYILAVASMYWGHYENWRDRLQQADPTTRRNFKRAYQQVVQATTYFDEVETADGVPPPRATLALAAERSKDMATFTAALSVLSASSLAPVLRLEPRLNAVRGDLKLLAHCCRAERRGSMDWKASRMIRRLGDKMRSLVNGEFLRRIDAPASSNQIEGLKLVSDLPLELMPTRGVPLGMRFDSSRLPPVPGNLFVQECLTPPIVLPDKAFDEVLVVRSFRTDDPIRHMFETAIRHIRAGQSLSRVSYRFVDVNSEDEFVAAITSYGGAVMVFDGHGRFDAATGMGTLVVGGFPMDPWALRRRCHLPPIVMFSACDTQPIDGSHSSVATAALMLGARAVLATMFPIFADHSAVFNARMLLRIEEFMPVALRIRPVLTWREVVGGMLRMSHASETLRILAKRSRITLDEAGHATVMMAANTAINARQADWHDQFVEQLASTTGSHVDLVREEIGRWAGLTDAMKHVQLGCPENIVITPGPRSPGIIESRQ